MNVSFTRDPKELWTALVFPNEQITAVTYDGSGNVIAATKGSSVGHLTKISGSGVALWSRSIDVRALATGPSDSIYILSGSKLMKIDSSSGDVWSAALDAKTSNACTTTRANYCIAVASDGSVVVHAPGGMGRWDTDGNPQWSIELTADYDGLTIDSGGIIYVGSESAGGETDARRFMADGTELTRFIEAGLEAGNVQFAIDASGSIVSSSFGFSSLYLTPFDDGTRTGLATSGTGSILWWNDDLGHDVYTVTVVNDDGSPVWTLSRPHYFSTNAFGVDLSDAAYSATGQLVVGGTYNGLSFQGAVLQTFQP